MHQNSNPVDWPVWLQNRPGDVRRADRMLVPLGSGWRCLLCGQTVTGSRADHHHIHMQELDSWVAGQAEAAGPKRDSIRRAAQRREQREEALERARALGEDSFRYAVDHVDPVTHRRTRRRRLRHPADETLARVKEMLAENKNPNTIKDELGVSRDYVLRLIRRIEGGGTSFGPHG